MFSTLFSSASRFLRLFLIPGFLFFGGIPACTNTSHQSQETSAEDILTQFSALEKDPSATKALFDSLSAAGKIPYTSGAEALFLYHGDAQDVRWAGEWDSWGNDTTFAKPFRISENAVALKLTFPENARLDYKVVADEVWMLDPANPHVQYSGFGPNSELRMPGWQPDPMAEDRAKKKGTLSESAEMTSEVLGTAVSYTVYIPAMEGPYNVVYVTDGHEYSDARLGGMINVLDNLHKDASISPTMAVFIDPRIPPEGHNRRMEYYVLHEGFQQFLDDELIPAIDAAYPTINDPKHRAILGTSLGGVHAMYSAITLPHRFSNIGIHSPAFHFAAAHPIFEMADSANFGAIKIFMSTGSIADTEAPAREMHGLLKGKNIDLQYIEVPESHSWGNWRSLIDEPLLHFWKR